MFWAVILTVIGSLLASLIMAVFGFYGLWEGAQNHDEKIAATICSAFATLIFNSNIWLLIYCWNHLK